MDTIQLLTPENGTITSSLHAVQCSGESGNDPGSSGQDVSAGNAIRWDALVAGSNDDRSIPLPVCFAWEDAMAASDGRVFDLHLSTEADVENALVFREITQPCRNVFNLRIGARYFWRVAARNGASVFAKSPVWSFTTHPEPPRWLYVPGITNVRDLGGWRLPGDRRVRQGLIYRSSEMNSHLDITDEGKRILVEELGIRTDIDLRGSSEEVMAVLEESLVKWINVPIKPYGYIVGDGENYRRIFELFADPSAYPILFHCWGGCDRGGTVAFLLHALLGLDMNSLARDYELSSQAIWGRRTRFSEEFLSLLNTLRPFGDRQDDYGLQAERFLLSTGLTAGSIAAIRAQLIEQTGGYKD